MGVGIDDVVGGATTGGLYNVANGVGMFGGGKTSTQVPLEDPAQAQARQQLADFASTGTFGKFTAGAEMPLGYGDYNATNAENQGQTSLQNLLAGGIPDQYKTATTALNSMASVDPAQIQAQFDPFKAQTERQIGESQKNLTRSAGYAGNLYSTSAIQGLGDIQARGNETLTSHLAALTNAALDRKLQAAQGLTNVGGAQQNSTLAQVDASQRYGDLTRSLNDQSIKARDAELLRRRSELQLPIQAAEKLAGSNVPFGVPSVTGPSPYQQLLGLAGQVGGTALGTYLGGPAGGMAGGKIGAGAARAASGATGAPTNFYTN